MIGTYLTLDLPLHSDTMSSMVAKTATALGQLRDSIADKATPAGLNVTTSLDFQANWGTNVGGLVLVDGNAPTAAGSFYYHSGEFYLIDSTSGIQLTKNGQLNAAAFGGIGGDYGGTNPALLSYNTSTGQYRFYTNSGTLAFGDAAVRAVVLEGSAGTTTLNCPSSVNVNQTIGIGKFSASPNYLVGYDGTNFIPAAAGTAYGNGLTFGGNVTAPDVRVTTAQALCVSLINAVPSDATAFTRVAGGTSGVNLGWSFKADSSTPTLTVPIYGVRGGDHIKSVTAYVTKATANTVTLTMKLWSSVINGSETAESTWTLATNSPGVTTSSSGAIDITVGTNKIYYLTITTSGSGVAADAIAGYEVDVTRP